MRKLLPLLVLLLTACNTTWAQDKSAEKNYTYLKAWEGRYPIQLPKDNPLGMPEQKENLWDDSKLIANFEKTLNSNRLNDLRSGWKNGIKASKVTMFDDYIAFFVCENHNCYENQTSIFVNVNTGQIEACWRSNSSLDGKQGGQEVWLRSSTAPKILKNGACNVEPLRRLFAINHPQ